MEAIERLLTGRPLWSDGSLNVKTLALEAKLGRHILTQKHTDLRDLFREKLPASQRPDNDREIEQRAANDSKLVRIREQLAVERQLNQSLIAQLAIALLRIEDLERRAAQADRKRGLNAVD
ncbi:hypothetical protein [Arthrobacter sp. NPDC058127]|uniref:hypothetical protein n=1 Tax=Arthrobacter sp. NPDC058127 TaxID=3346351 RepID=UPI0036F0753D